MFKVGLTGNIASGKSTVARFWAEAGVPVISADDLARDVVAPGTPGLDAVRAEFGSAFITSEGTLDRESMRALVFDDPDARRRLEGILHPLIRAGRDEWMAAQRARGSALVVAEIPLLIETGMQDEFDCVVLVDAPLRVRRERIIATRGLGEEQAEKIMRAQMDPAAKRAAADHVVENGGSLDELRSAALALISQLRATAADPPAPT